MAGGCGKTANLASAALLSTIQNIVDISVDNISLDTYRNIG
jgi:hypothetical protein